MSYRANMEYEDLQVRLQQWVVKNKERLNALCVKGLSLKFLREQNRKCSTSLRKRIRPFIRQHVKVSWLLDAMVSFVQQQQLARYAKQDRAKQDRAKQHPARTVTLSEQDLRKLCDMVAENVVKQLAARYDLRQISIQKTQVGNTCRRKGNS